MSGAGAVISCVVGSDCTFHQARTVEALDALLERTSSAEIDRDLDEGFDVCEAVARQLTREALR